MSRVLGVGIVCLVFAFPVVAAEPPTPTPQPTCDLCGWCNPATQPKPPNWQECHNCLYTDTGEPQTRTYYTVLGCLSTKPEKLAQSVLTLLFGISGGIAFLTFLLGAGNVLTSSGDPIKLKTGKDMITSSILGILLIIFSVFLLRTVGLTVLQIPGFG